MNRMTGGEAAVELLRGHGVEVVFGLCGDTSLPLYDALKRLDHGITHVLTRDERHAGYMADVYARLTGRVGVCEGPSGGGATYILPALVEANESSVPVLGLTTDISTTGRGRFTLTELDQEALFRPVTKWNAVIDTAAGLPNAFRRAFREATTGRPGAVHLGLPLDIQRAAVDDDTAWSAPEYGRLHAQRADPDPAACEAAAKLLAAAERPVIVCGGGPVISEAFEEVAGLAEALAAPVATSVSGKGILADDHPLSLGVVGSNGGTPETRAVVENADLVMFVGCRAGSVTTERWRFPAPDRARIVHVDIDPAAVGANYDVDAAVLGDARRALDGILAALDGERWDSSDAAARVAAAKKAKFEAFEALAASEEKPIRPERLIATLNRLLPDDAVIVADPGTPCPYFSAFYRLPTAGRHFISNRAHGALGFALPASVGAAFARPDAKTVAVMGDGSFGMAAGELETIKRLGLPITLVVVSNAVYGWIKAGQRSSFEERYFSVDFSETDHARVAEAFGIPGFRVEDPADLEPTLAKALKTDGPTLVDVVSQPLHEARAPVSEWIA